MLSNIAVLFQTTILKHYKGYTTMPYVVRMLKTFPRRNRIIPVSRELHLLKMHDIIRFKILLLTHKATSIHATVYLSNLISVNEECDCSCMGIL